jgi:23S rRNA (pseudouridine1915-N3)-methyltransferase
VKISVISVGNKMPAWVKMGVKEYLKRFPPQIKVSLTELPVMKSSNQSEKSQMEAEAERLLAKASPRAKLVVLDERGSLWSTVELSQHLQKWMQDGQDIDLMIGGANGLAPQIRERADQIWSLSNLTLPHMMVRVVVVEQLYRAMSILNNHPYHREG